MTMNLDTFPYGRYRRAIELLSKGYGREVKLRGGLNKGHEAGNNAPMTDLELSERPSKGCASKCPLREFRTSPLISSMPRKSSFLYNNTAKEEKTQFAL